MNSFGSRSILRAGKREFEIYRLDALEKQGCAIRHLPYSLRILLENLLRREDGKTVKADDVRALTAWSGKAVPSQEIAFMPSRVLLQDFTGVPAVVDLAAMRDAMKALGGDPRLINPLQPAELVIDHSVQVDEFGTPQAFQLNAELEFSRNRERYAFLRWGQTAFKNFAIVPPDTGIVHQINLEYLARVVFVGAHGETGKPLAYPDTLVGTDSHTTMVNGLGVLGWGVGGIEAEAAMLGQPVSMLIPQVVGVRLDDQLREGSTATDLVLTVTEMLRKKGVVGKFVEFFGPGLHDLPLADRATIANMAPEYGATCGIFPVDDETLRYLRLSGRSAEQIGLVEAYCKEQGLFHTADTPEAEYTDVLELDLATVEPSIAGPKRPQDRVALSAAAKVVRESAAQLAEAGPDTFPRSRRCAGKARADIPPASTRSSDAVEEHVKLDDSLNHGSVVIAAITSCTNTSNPSVMVAAGLLAKKAVEKGLTGPAVGEDLARAGLEGGDRISHALRPDALPREAEVQRRRLRLHHLHRQLRPAAAGGLRRVTEQGPGRRSVLSGNRNFEGRINSEVRANYLMSPPLVVAFALAGRMDIDVYNEPLGYGGNGKRGPVYLKDIWPTAEEVAEVVRQYITGDLFQKAYADVFKGDERWRGLNVPEGETFAWDDESTYVKNPPYFDNMPQARAGAGHLRRARALLSRQQRDHRPHLARRLHQERQPRRQVPDRARREAGGLQLLRIAPRQSRSDDARHLRQRAAAQQAGAGARGRRSRATSPTARR